MKPRIHCTIIAASALVLSGCDIEQTKEAELPDVDVKVEKGRLPDVDVEVTDKGKLPDVDVDVEGGQAPEFEIKTAEVDGEVKKETVEVPVPKVGVKEKQVTVPVPEVEVEKEKVEVRVPDIDVKMPKEDEPVEEPGED